nr:hypothetical protein [uncultured Roseococcus sp.]
MKLSNFAAPLAAASDGLWLPCGDGWGDVKLRVRPYTEPYQAELSRMQAELVRRARVDGLIQGRDGYEDLPLDMRLKLSRELLLDRLIVDIRGAENDDGSATTIEQFRANAKDLDNWGPSLADKAFELVAKVTTDRAVLRAAAAGNSGRTSGSSPAPAKPPS